MYNINIFSVRFLQGTKPLTVHVCSVLFSLLNFSYNRHFALACLKCINETQTFMFLCCVKVTWLPKQEICLQTCWADSSVCVCVTWVGVGVCGLPCRAMDQLFVLDMGLLVCYCIVFSCSASLMWKSAFFSITVKLKSWDIWISSKMHQETEGLPGTADAVNTMTSDNVNK